ncbi:MAG: threonine/serine dehydratase [bacterium]
MLLEFGDIIAAKKRLEGVVRQTPVLVSIREQQRSYAKIYYKCENLQRAGAFKLRGAYNKIASISKERRGYGVVAFSSGNHARAVATASSLLGIHAKIVMPKDAPKNKLAATKEVGAEIILYDRYTEDRVAIAEEIRDREKRTLVPPFDDPLIIAGQGTIGLEIDEQIEQLDFLVAPIGGGGLISGVALALAEKRPGVCFIGAEAESANKTYLSMQQGERVEIPVPQTLADGMQLTSTGEITFKIMKVLLQKVILVSEDEIVDSMYYAANEIRQIIEPTSAVAVAAARKLAQENPGAHIAIVLSGGNIDLTRYSELIATQTN